MKNKTSHMTEGFKLVIRIVLEILVPVLICLLALNYIFMIEFVKALGISEHSSNIIRIDMLVCGVSFVMVSAAVINMTMKGISPARRNIGAVLPPLSSDFTAKSAEPKDNSCSFADTDAAVEAVREGLSGVGPGIAADEKIKLTAGSSNIAADFTSLLNGSMNGTDKALETGRYMEPMVNNTAKNSCLPSDLISIYDVDRAVRAVNLNKIKHNLLYMSK